MNSVELENLNSLLKGELSAVDTYDTALKEVHARPKVVSVLEQAKKSHEERVEKLRQAIIASGGTPVNSPGAWGSFARLITSGASKLGEKAVLTALEEGEDVGSNNYEWKILSIHGKNRKLVRDELWPKQEATHKLVSEVLHNETGGTWPPAPHPHDA